MIQALEKYSKVTSWFLAGLFYLQIFVLPLTANAEALPYIGLASTGIPVFKKPTAQQPAPVAIGHPAAEKIKHAPLTGAGKFGTGPSQPEMQAFTSVSSSNMVDLFSGDFSYNIPLMDVGGYPINIVYRSGVTMDQEASWVGLGWNINPGTISRNMRGLPDDFNGLDSVKKVTSIKENKTIGVSVGGGMELVGVPGLSGKVDSTASLGLGLGVGVFHNNYRGWGIENSVNASIRAGIGSKGSLTAGLALTNNSQEGLTVSPSLMVALKHLEAATNSGYGANVSASLPYNSRTGLKGLQLSVGTNQFKTDGANQHSLSGSVSSLISFAVPSYTPSIQNSFISRQFSFNAQIGFADEKILNPYVYINGYVSKQRIDADDTLMSVPAYGYLHFTEGARNYSALLDFNREKELTYREKPATPHIAVPVYTYDAFSITGEGTGGMFRAYRGDVGFVFDHSIRSKDESDRFSADLGFGDLFHAGIDLNVNRAFTQNGPWLLENALKNSISFKDSGALYEPVYFRNPGEKSINSKKFYDSLGGDDVVSVDLYQAGIGPFIQATNYLTRYNNKHAVGKIHLTPQNTIRQERDKRTQVISYLTAKQASIAGLSKYIESYDTATYTFDNCTSLETPEPPGTGLPAEYFNNTKLKGPPAVPIASEIINLNLKRNAPKPGVNVDFSSRWKGRLLAPVTGSYNIIADSTDDGVKLWLNDSLVINDPCENCAPHPDTAKVNLIAGEYYDIKVEYADVQRDASIQLKWTHPSQTVKTVIPRGFLYGAPVDPVHTGMITREKRYNSFRKEHHISEIDVLNSDGRRYVYGIPVYNFKQREATFAVNGKDRGNKTTGLVGYSPQDNSTKNMNGKDRYFSSEEMPAYPHSFLLTGILSADFVDATGNGISDDDLGDAIKFNYSKISGLNNPYRWRAPFNDSLTYNEGLRTDSRDDKGNYVYGERELWYLHSVESKTMVAIFVLEGRLDIPAITDAGTKVYDGSARRLKEIRLYTKSDLKKNTIAHARAIKTVHFEYSYELCQGVNKPLSDSGKLTLKKIWFTYNGNKKGAQNPYVFNYNSKNPAYNIKSYDRWGNYKDPLENPGSSGGNLISNAEYPYSIQDSIKAANNAAAWALDSIKLPSGGALKVTYESDDYAFVQNKRAMQLFKILGLGTSSNFTAASNRLYTIGGDNLYVFISVPAAVSDTADMYRKYLSGINKLYFRLSVQMPADEWGSGNEYVSCYADLAAAKSYGIASSNVIWVKLAGISLKGDAVGNFSPLAKAGLQFLRLNLPSKAYPGSEVGDDVDVQDAVKMLASMLNNVVNAYASFDVTGRLNGWAKYIDTARSYVRLNSPLYRKYGGGYRVKQITVYDRWNKMTGESGKPAKYGQQYIYTTTRDINGVPTTISSGVASYEPGIGGDENPFHEPIEYVEKISALGPVTLAYSEEPLGESFFPAAGVGYSKVRVRTINYQNVKSANGYDETNFYTAYDFPTYTDRSLIDDNTRKRYKPGLTNFLRIDVKHYLTLSQGFKVELNDMHGKVRSQASYAETDPKNPITYTENIYRVENPRMENKRLANVVPVIRPDGTIDTTALIGKDVELMVDMREQLSISNGYNINLNTDMFSIPFAPPLFILPSFLNLAQREETRYRSVATVKIIQRYGILDSVIHIDKGSKISTKDILYDSETGNAVLTRTQNEFNDFVYNFTYPSHWAYDGMGLAYRNIGGRFDKVTIRNGRITAGLPAADSVLFASGDEIIVGGKLPTDSDPCNPKFSTFPSYIKIWAIDSSVLNGGPKTFFFLDKEGRPYNGFDVSLRIVRSGRKNIDAAIGSVTTLANPLVKNGSNQYELRFSDTTKIIAAAATEMKQFWHVADQKRRKLTVSCPVRLPQDCAGDTSCICTCLKTLFRYLVASRRLFIHQNENITVSSLVANANSAGYSMTVNDCELLQMNSDKLFYALTTDSFSNFYRARIGDCTVGWRADKPVNFYTLGSPSCDSAGQVVFSKFTTGTDTVTQTFYPTKSMVHYYAVDYDSINNIPSPSDYVDSATYKLVTAYYTQPLESPDNLIYNPVLKIFSFLKFDISSIPVGAQIQQATLDLNAFSGGFSPSQYTQPHSAPLGGFSDLFSIGVPSFNWTYSTATSTLRGGFDQPFTTYTVSTSGSQNLSVNAKPFVEEWIAYGNRGLRFAPNYGVYEKLAFSTFASERVDSVSNRPKLEVTYTATVNDTTYAYLGVEFCRACDTIIDNTCRSIVQDTAFNPFTTGALGNWRSNKSYTYYGQRSESDPTSVTNIRTNGTFKDFAAFWKFENNQLKPHADTARWVWNSQTTMFNPKGLEIENKDPLGRYNAGLYGYKLTLPVAVVQNARYRESAFEGFEDYDFSTQVCDTGCATDRHFDFSAFRNKLDTTFRHTGKRSLKLNGGEQAAMTVRLAPEQELNPSLVFTTLTNSCGSGMLANIKSSNAILIPAFSPLRGKKMVLSAWVKEGQACSCTDYTNNRIVIAFSGGSSEFLQPTGNIIEGWQRYESVFEIPATDSTITISLEATGTTAVYFDDVRIHPFNANMKSFVYSPLNLRLMAELDENNYATIYEYDDDGTLIRVKKETERGIKTIKETRSALLKEQSY